MLGAQLLTGFYRSRRKFEGNRETLQSSICRRLQHTSTLQGTSAGYHVCQRPTIRDCCLNNLILWNLRLRSSFSDAVMPSSPCRNEKEFSAFNYKFSLSGDLLNCFCNTYRLSVLKSTIKIRSTCLATAKGHGCTVLKSLQTLMPCAWIILNVQESTLRMLSVPAASNCKRTSDSPSDPRFCLTRQLALELQNVAVASCGPKAPEGPCSSVHENDRPVALHIVLCASCRQPDSGLPLSYSFALLSPLVKQVAGKL